MLYKSIDCLPLLQTNAKTKEEAWFLQEVEIEHVKKKKRWVFLINKWFSLFHTDQQLSRELYPMVSSNTSKQDIELIFSSISVHELLCGMRS